MSASSSKVSESLLSGKRPPRVLLVDDDELVLELTSVALEAADCEVKVVRSHESFMLTSTIRDFMPDVVLVDDHMPAMKGTQLITAAKQDCRHPCAYVLYSANQSHEELSARAHACGADGYIEKTGALDSLVQGISRYISPEATPELDNNGTRLRTLRELEQQQGRTGWVARLVENFLASMKKYIDTMEKAHAGGAPTELKRAAHALKGGAVQLGAVPLADVLEQIQMNATSMSDGEIEHMLVTVRAHAKRTERWLKSEIEK